MKLIIAEKPSLGRTIASAVGACSRKDGYIEGNGYIVSWCFGHLYELADPERYWDADHQKGGRVSWEQSMSHLPFFPDDWKFLYEPKQECRKQIRILKGLINSPDTDLVYAAGDADREGEVIVRLVLEANMKKPKKVLRIWLSSLTDEVIRKAQIHINHVMNDERSFDEVVAAASGRMKSDLADGCSFETVSLESYSYGMDAAHLSEQQAAFFMMKNADCYLKEYDFELTERSDFLSDVMGWEARIIGEKAVEEVLTELEQAGIDIRNDLAVSEFYDYRRPALDNVIEVASNRIGSPDNTLEKEIEEARGC